MAVLIEALNVIVNDKSLDERPGVKDLFLNNIPSNAYCCDGLIHRIGFMDPAYVGEYIGFLENVLGLDFLDINESSIDIVVIDMLTGPTTNCDWIGFKRGQIFKHRSEFEKSQENFSIAWHLDCFDGDSGNRAVLNSEYEHIEMGYIENGISYPFGWTPDKALYASDFSGNPEEDLEEISRTETIITYRRFSTGEIVYVAIPTIENGG